MNITFENKVALVTGAASGIGLATAKAFAVAGASVVLADWNEMEVQTAAKDLASKGHKTLAVRCSQDCAAREARRYDHTIREHEGRAAASDRRFDQAAL